MPATFRLRPLALVLLVAAGTSLTACGVAEEAKKTMDELANAHVGSFEDVTRTPLDGATDGRTFLLRAVAREEVQWQDAWAAFAGLPGGYCADGVPYALQRISPSADPESRMPDTSARYPAGTVFEHEVSCTDPFRGQRLLDPDTDVSVGSNEMWRELGEGVGSDDRGRLVSFVTFNDRNPKYEAVTQSIGNMVLSTQRRCRDAGVEVRQILIHSKPTPHPSEGVFLNRSEALVGLYVACADGAPLDDEL